MLKVTLTSDDQLLLLPLKHEGRSRRRPRADAPLEHMGGGLLTAVLLMMLLAAALQGRWDGVVAIPALFGLARWGLPWLLRLAWRGIRAWWHGLVLILVLGVLLSGCADMVRTVAHINGYKGDIYESPCAPQSLQAGHCVAKEGAKP